MKEPLFPCLSELVDLACAIQQIPAPTFQEGERAQFMLQQFVQLNLHETWIDSAGNVFGKLQGKGKRNPVILSAHLDTVHPLDTPLILERDPLRIKGPGIGDNSLGLAALIGLVWMLTHNQTDLPGDLWLVANICEEGLGNLRGIQAVVDRFNGFPLAYIVLEGSALGEIYHQGLGVDRYRISIFTEGGHSWHDFGKPSAIHILTQIAAQILEIEVPSSPRSTLNIGKINGGVSVNTIAPNATLELDLRSEEPKGLQSMIRQLKEILTHFEQAEVDIQFDQIGYRPAGRISSEHPLVGLAIDSLTKVGIDAHLSIGSTDANIPLSQGYPAVCVGITSGGKVHTTDEYIDVPPIAQGMQQLFWLTTGIWNTL